MQRRSPSFYNKRRAKQTVRFNLNRQIRVPQVVLIDETGANMGIKPTAEALRLADERGFDLVEVNPAANPPVAKLLDSGQWQYELEKQRKKQKARQKKTGLKGVRLSLRIGEHDLETRRGQARRFLAEGHKVKVEIVLRGRERGFSDAGRRIMQDFVQSLGEGAFIEQPFSKQGGKLSLVTAKKG